MKKLVVLLGLICLVLLPFSAASAVYTQPYYQGTYSDVLQKPEVYVGGAKEVIKSPYYYPIVKKTTDYRMSKYRPETYVDSGYTAVFLKPSSPVKYIGPTGYLKYGIPSDEGSVKTKGGFQSFTLVYGVDTQVVKRFVPFRYEYTNNTKSASDEVNKE